MNWNEGITLVEVIRGVLWRNPMNARRSRPKSFRACVDCDIVAEAALEGYRGYPPRIDGREREWRTGHASMRCWAKPACFFEGGGCLDPRGGEFEEISPHSLIPVDLGGKSHYVAGMPTTALKQKARPILTVVEHYDVAADAKKRISLRNAKTKYFHVQALSDGRFLLEPRVLVPTKAVSGRTLKMLDEAAANFKKGVVSPPIDLSPFLKG
jgi:hypothetical protein